MWISFSDAAREMYWIECGWRRAMWQEDSSWPNCPHHAPFSVDDTCFQIQKRTKVERPPSLLAPRGDGTTQIDVGHQRRRYHSPREWRGIVPPKPCRNRLAFIPTPPKALGGERLDRVRDIFELALQTQHRTAIEQASIGSQGTTDTSKTSTRCTRL
jgi:hypothetical protein